jgi:hypothetical protein
MSHHVNVIPVYSGLPGCLKGWPGNSAPRRISPIWLRLREYTPVAYDDLSDGLLRTPWGVIENLDVGQRVLLDWKRLENYSDARQRVAVAAYMRGCMTGRKYRVLKSPEEGMWVMREQ